VPFTSWAALGCRGAMRFSVKGVCATPMGSSVSEG
jgi:hypothetical protein